MGDCGETSAGYVPGLDSAGGYSLGDDDSSLERGGGVSGHWDSRSFVEGVISSSELLLEKNCRVSQHSSWFKGRAGDGDGYFGGQSSTAAVRYCTRYPLTGIPGFTLGL